MSEPGTGAGIDEGAVASLYGKSLLLTSEWSTEQIEALCGLAERLQELDRRGRLPPLCPEELHMALFFDSSTRTKSSWAGAAARLGARPLVIEGASTQVSHGETAEETGAMLGMNAHALGFRHDLILGEGHRFMRLARQGLDAYLTAIGDQRVVPVVNLQCDVDHPTQSLADLCWLRERFPDRLAGRRIAVTWAYSPSYAKPLSVPQGLITLLPRFGMEVRLAFPQGYDLTPQTVERARELAETGGGALRIVESMDEAFAGADIVYPKSWGPYDLMLERVEANRQGDAARLLEVERLALERNRLHTDWICDERRMASTRDGRALYMHCLPADIGSEVSSGVMEAARVDVAREANKKVYVIAAVLAAAKHHDLPRRLAEAA